MQYCGHQNGKKKNICMQKELERVFCSPPYRNTDACTHASNHLHMYQHERGRERREKV